VLGRDVARAERYGEPLTLCLLKAETVEAPSELVADALLGHVRATVERITRASDSWYEVGQGVFAVVLERCSAAEAASFGERLAIAAGSRPVIADGARVPVSIIFANTQYDAHQFVGARDFFAAACSARMAAPGHRQRLVSDGRFLRDSVYGREATRAADQQAGAA
jgi:GGDEF domain-containing protein